MVRINKEHVKEYIFVSSFLISFLIVFKLINYELTTSDPYYYRVIDHLIYINMALNPMNVLAGSIGPPFCYRILMPFLAYLLPFGLQVNFQIITYISFFFTGLILYETFKILFNKILSLTGVIFFYSLRWAALFSFYDFWLPDSLAFLFIALCFWAIIKSNYRIYILSICIGVLAKEIVLFTIPVMLLSEFYKLENKNPFQKEFLKKSIILTSPGIITFFLLHIIIVPNPSYTYNYFKIIQTISLLRFQNDIFAHLDFFYYIITISTWGLIHFIFPLFNSKSVLINWIKLYGIFTILVYAQLIIALNVQRLLVAGFFPVILLTLEGMKRWNEKTGINPKYFILLSISYFCIQILSNFFYIFEWQIIFIGITIGIPLLFQLIKYFRFKYKKKIQETKE